LQTGGRALQRQIQMTVQPGEFDIEVVYVQPAKAPTDEGVIDFETFAQVVEGHPDEVSQVFALHLRRWVRAAGTARPG